VRSACSVLLSLLAVASATGRLKIDVRFEGVKLPAAGEAAAAEEVRTIWAPYGVDIRVVTHAAGAARPDAIPLRVTLVDRGDPRLPTETLGSIDFHDGTPEPSIVLYPASTSELVSWALIGHAHEWPAAMHDRLFGRVLGRALAHEIGHFLLRRQGHSSKGLMRAQQPVPDLMREDRSCCILSAADVLALDAVIEARVSGM
jgi:hypothetical protein